MRRGVQPWASMTPSIRLERSPEVVRIMDALLVDLTRSRGSNLRVTLEIRGSSGEPDYPKDVADTVQSNARDLKQVRLRAELKAEASGSSNAQIRLAAGLPQP